MRLSTVDSRRSVLDENLQSAMTSEALIVFIGLPHPMMTTDQTAITG